MPDLLFWTVTYTALEAGTFHPVALAGMVAENQKSALSGSSKASRLVQSFRANLSVPAALSLLSGPGQRPSRLGLLRGLATGYPLTFAYHLVYDLWMMLPYVALRDALRPRFAEMGFLAASSSQTPA